MLGSPAPAGIGPCVFFDPPDMSSGSSIASAEGANLERPDFKEEPVVVPSEVMIWLGFRDTGFESDTATDANEDALTEDCEEDSLSAFRSLEPA